MLGLTFKPGTDDLREAPSLDNIPLLLEAGADIYAYDPIGASRFRERFPEGIQYTDTLEETLQGANVCFAFTEWEEIRNVTPQQFKEWMRTALLYDGRNMYDKAAMESAGVEYYGVGR